MNTMTVGPLIGKRPRARNEGLVGLLLECHERIRRFATLAIRLANAEEASASEVRDAAGAVRRYFAEALPLHVADEEESVLPRLRGIDPSVDQALEEMRAEHSEHAGLVAELVSLCTRLEMQPASHPELRERLADVAERLDEQFESHLEREETVLFPRLAEIGEQARREIVEELRARRGPSTSHE